METKKIISKPAMRLKKIRLYLAMNRQTFGETLGISQFTIRSWENGMKLFTDEGMLRIVNALREYLNFNCSLEWLQNGMGQSPISFYENKAASRNNEIVFDSLQEKLLQEVVTFKQNNPEIITIAVSDQTFSPLATIGDYLGFNKIDLTAINRFVGKIVYYYLQEDTSVFGILTSNPNGYCISSMSGNLDSTLQINESTLLYHLVWFRKSVS